MKTKRQLAAAMAIVTLWCQSPLASAAVYSFSGVIDTNNSDHANLTSFNGAFSFDPTRPDLAPADSHNGQPQLPEGLHHRRAPDRHPGFDLNDFGQALFSYHGLAEIAPGPG